jgi:hypothetical protein
LSSTWKNSPPNRLSAKFISLNNSKKHNQKSKTCRNLTKNSRIKYLSYIAISKKSGKKTRF